MSNNSANNGGNLGFVKRNQLQWALCFRPNDLNSGILASRAGISCRACVVPLRERTICTLKASVMRSLVRAIILASEMPGLSEANKTMAENRPISVSLRPYTLIVFAKLKSETTKSVCKKEKKIL